MHEARDTELSPSSTSIKPILVVAGAVVGLLLLVCGGAAGYVALTAPPRAEEQAPVGGEGMSTEMNAHMLKRQKQMATQQIPLTADPAVVRKIAAMIVDIDLPADFEPIEASRNASKRRAVFGKETESAALLKLAGVDRQFVDNAAAASSDDAIRMQVVQMAENENGRIDTKLKTTRQKMKSAQRELTVLGQKAVFEFKEGKRDSDKKLVWKIWGAFATPTGVAAIIYLVPESDFDEEAVVRMIESIRPAPDEEPDTDEKSAPLQPIPEKSIPEKSIPGKSIPGKSIPGKSIPGKSTE